MADWLKDQVAWLHRFRQQHMDQEDIEYIQGGVRETIPMTLMREMNEHLTDFGQIMINTRRQDFIADPNDFVAVGFEMPDRGDKIIRTVDGQEIVYDVCPDGEDPAWRYMTRYRMAIRIHTNRESVNTVTPP